MFAGSNRRDKPLIADQRVDDEHADDEDEQPGENAAPAALRALACLSLTGCRVAMGDVG